MLSYFPQQIYIVITIDLLKRHVGHAVDLLSDPCLPFDVTDTCGLAHKALLQEKVEVTVEPPKLSEKKNDQSVVWMMKMASHTGRAMMLNLMYWLNACFFPAFNHDSQRNRCVNPTPLASGLLIANELNSSATDQTSRRFNVHRISLWSEGPKYSTSGSTNKAAKFPMTQALIPKMPHLNYSNSKYLKSDMAVAGGGSTPNGCRTQSLPQ